MMKRPVAAHVQAALAKAAQCRPADAARPMAAHVQRAVERTAGALPPARPVQFQAHGSRSLQPANFDVTAFNAQRGNADNERKRRQAERAIERGDVPFLSEMSTTFPVPATMTMIDSRGRANPSGGLNYVVPVGSTIHEPTVPADAAAALGGVGRPATYGGLMGPKGRRPVALGTTPGGVDVFGFHAKSRPGYNAQYALAAFVLELIDAGGNFILVGDLNLEPADLQSRIDELRPGTSAGLHFVGLGRATQTSGKELDYGVTDVAGVTVEQISRANLRGGSDHSGIGFTL